MRLACIPPCRRTVQANATHSVLRRGRPVAAVLAISLVVVACGGNGSPQGRDGATSAADPTALRVSFVPATTVLPLQVAQTQGFFERNGLNVTLTQAANISDIPVTLGRQFDLSLGTATDLIRAGGAGLDVVQVAGNTNSTKDNPFVQLVVRPDSGITDVTQLRDKTVGTPTLSGVIHAAVQFWAKQKASSHRRSRLSKRPAQPCRTSSRRDESTPSRRWNPLPASSREAATSLWATHLPRSPIPWPRTSG